jgi:hypothetical protein
MEIASTSQLRVLSHRLFFLASPEFCRIASFLSHRLLRLAAIDKNPTAFLMGYVKVALFLSSNHDVADHLVGSL